jgi:dTDP-4-dehydrorhamnose 3,5-epimerase-like enzyme
MKDMDGKFVEWMKKESDTATYSEFLQKHFSLSEMDVEKLEPKDKKKRKKRKRK